MDFSPVRPQRSAGGAQDIVRPDVSDLLVKIAKYYGFESDRANGAAFAINTRATGDTEEDLKMLDEILRALGMPPQRAVDMVRTFHHRRFPKEAQDAPKKGDEEERPRATLEQLERRVGIRAGASPEETILQQLAGRSGRPGSGRAGSGSRR